MNVDKDLHVWLETALPRLLPDFLQTQRWFGGKARGIRAVEFDDAVWLTTSRRTCALAVVSVRYVDGAPDRYALLVAFVVDRADLPVVGRLDGPGVATWAVEAGADAEAARALLSGLVASEAVPTERGGTLRFGDTDQAAVRALAESCERGTFRGVGVEQSNTSLRLDRTLVFKLFRKLEVGENPELEIGRFLTTRTTFRAMPRLQGSVTYVSVRGEPSTIGVLQDWIENRGDGWNHVVAALQRPPDESDRAGLLGDLVALGATTADFHASLACDPTVAAFAPEAATAADVEAWRPARRARTAHALALVERSLPGWPEPTRRLGESLLDQRRRAAARLHGPGATPAQFHKIRIHGDYHLGQTLKTGDGFVLIDFEGEPARPLADRRDKHCALKDVAGMFRSFDYAVETAGPQDPRVAGTPLSAHMLRNAFLEGYLRAAVLQGALFVPRERRAIDTWIEFFEVEKAFYELEYEINSRPAWVHIPLRGILDILDGRG